MLKQRQGVYALGGEKSHDVTEEDRNIRRNIILIGVVRPD